MKRVLVVLLIAIPSAGIAWLIWQHFDELRAADWRFEPARLILGLLLQVSTIGIATLVWVELSHALGADKNPRRETRTYAYAILARRLPGAVWHVVGRASAYAEIGLGRRIGVGGSAIEAILLVVTGASIGMICLPIAQPWGAMIGVPLLLIGPAAGRWFACRVGKGRLTWLPKTRLLYRLTCFDCIAWLVGSTGVYLQIDSLYRLDPTMFPRIVAAATLSIVGSAIVVIVPGGLGLRELGFTTLLADIVPVGIAATLAIGLRVTVVMMELLWAAGVLAFVRAPRGVPVAQS